MSKSEAVGLMNLRSEHSCGSIRKNSLSAAPTRAQISVGGCSFGSRPRRLWQLLSRMLRELREEVGRKRQFGGSDVRL